MSTTSTESNRNTNRRTAIFGCLAALWMIGLIVAAMFFRSYRSEQEKSEKPNLLFNGRNLDGWKVADKHFFADSGKVTVENQMIVMEAGTPGTGIQYTKPFPKMNYEVSLEAQRMEGSDFFCGLTFPIHDSFCTLIIGGWGGTVIGLSNVDGENASENETTNGMTFKNGQWYRIRLQVREDGIGVWIDDKSMIELDSLEHQFDIWWEQDPMKPFGIASWYTKAALRNLEVRLLGPVKQEAKQ